jgi:guanylate kinase
MEREKVLIVIGACSGTGKTYLMNNLVAYRPNAFRVLRQVTTRSKRDGEGDTYDFINKEEYDKIVDKLIGRCEINGCFYGTMIPEDLEGKIGLVILNEQGYMDMLHSPRMAEVERVIFIGLEHDKLDDLVKVVNREGRDVEYLKAEQKITRFSDICYDVTNKYVQPEEVVEGLKSFLYHELGCPIHLHAYNRLVYDELFIKE